MTTPHDELAGDIDPDDTGVIEDISDEMPEDPPAPESRQGKGAKKARPGKIAKGRGGASVADAAQKAPGKGKRKEELVRHDRRGPQRRSLKQIIRALWRMVVALFPFAGPFVAFFLWGDDQQSALDYFSEHLGLVLMPLLPILASLRYSINNHMRTHPPQPKRGPRRLPLPPLPPTMQHGRDVNDIVANLDHLLYRLFYWGMAGAAVVLAGRVFPVSVDMIVALPQDVDTYLRPVLIGLLAPVVAFAIPRMRAAFVIKQRWAEIEECYTIAKATLGYIKRLPARPRGREVREATPWLAIDVKKWSALYEIDEFFVLAPETLSVEKVSPWDEFTANLNTKMPRPEEWRIQKDSRGRGATVGPANYPTEVLWDGEYDPDPLTFYLGIDLESGERQTLTFSDVSPHMAISGGTSSGKALSLLSVVATIDGPKRVEDVRLGDLLAAPGGDFAPVVGMSPIRKSEAAYRLTFHDGTTEDCSGDHLWTTWDRSARRALSRQRTQGHTRARAPWLSDEQRSLLAAELEMTQPGDDISLPQVAVLLGVLKDTPPLVQTAKMIGVCRETNVTREFVYADQVVQQEQTCMVFDRTEVPTLYASMANSPRAAVREAAASVKVLEKNGQGPVSIPDLTRVTGIDRTRMRGLVKRSGVNTLRKEKIMLTLDVPGKVVSRAHPKTTFFYPKRPLLEALIQRGLLDGNDQRHKMALPAVRTTKEIAETLRYRAAGAAEDAASWANHSIPRTAPVQFPEQDLALDPYVLGAWLGDGPSWGTTSWASEDPELMEEIEVAGFGVREYKAYQNHKRYYVTGLRGYLRRLGLLRNKHIPDAYLYASVEQRLALLQGLMDTDGSVNRTSGTCEFYQSDEKLVRQVRSLVASLGMIAHIRSKPGGYRDALTGEWVECKEAWTVEFSPTMQVFRLPRKAALIDPEANRSKSEHRYIVSVEPIEPVPMRCLMVDSDDHQFLVSDQYIPTHNTSAAEIIAAQVLIKPMPWDPDLRGMVVVVDPKGPFARRWVGRPGVVVANGQEDAAEPVIDPDTGDETLPTGVEVMASCMQWIEVEHQRRQSVLKRYPDVGTWVHLPDEVKKAERFFPIFVVLDEYIDHTDKEKANGDPRIERENNARDVITRLAGWHARKYRNVGMHTGLIAQEVKMTGNTGIGSALMRQLPVRIVTGQMDASQLTSMFGNDREIPSLPSSRVVIENGERRVKTIPGRARIMNAFGQTIHKVQIMWFGGSTNSETLDKWLPRGEAPLNGNFSLPAGAPRSPSDFDAEGNLINPEPPVAAHADAMEDLPMDANEPSARDFSPTEMPAHVKPEGSEVDEGDEEDPWGLSEIEPDADLSAVFPMADASVPRCEHEDCVNDADRKCPSCEKGYCQYHLLSSPDPDERGLMCASCAAQHPLSRTDVADVYRKMRDMGRDAGLTASYTVDGGGREVLAVLRTPRAKKVIEIRGVEGGALRARSKSGEVEGDEVYDRVDSAIESYRSRRAEASASEAS